MKEFLLVVKRLLEGLSKKVVSGGGGGGGEDRA